MRPQSQGPTSQSQDSGPDLHTQVPTGQGSARSGWPSGCPCTEWMGRAVPGWEVLNKAGCPGWAMSSWQPHPVSGSGLVVREQSAQCSGVNLSPIIKTLGLPGSRASPEMPPVLSSQTLGAAGLGVSLGGRPLVILHMSPKQESRSWGQQSWAQPWHPDAEHGHGLRALGRLGPHSLPEASIFEKAKHSTHEAVLFPTWGEWMRCLR